MSETEKDIRLLECMITCVTTATDENGREVMHILPCNSDYIELCNFIFTRHGIDFNKYKHESEQLLVLTIPLAEIDRLPPSARAFLYSIKFYRSCMKEHAKNYLSIMKNKRIK